MARFTGRSIVVTTHSKRLEIELLNAYWPFGRFLWSVQEAKDHLKEQRKPVEITLDKPS